MDRGPARRAVGLLLLVNALALAGLAAWASAGWPGKANHIVADKIFYCEALRPGWVRQPSNTWSCLAFVAVGLFLAARAKSWRAALLAVLVSLIGPASMALHASMTTFGGVLDTTSMFLFIGFCAAHNAARLEPRLDGGFAAFYAALACALALLANAYSEICPTLFGMLIVVFLAGETVLFLKRAAGGRDRRWLGAAAVLFAAGYGFWVPSESSTGPLCVSSTSLLQGHAAWHLLCALAAGALFLYLEPELGPEAALTPPSS
jgi:hypothetical protein